MNNRFLLVALGFESLLVLVSLAVGWLCAFSPWYDASSTEMPRFEYFAQMLLWGWAGTAPPVAVLLLEDNPRWQALTALKHQVSRMLDRLVHGAAYWQLFLLACLAGIGEELLYRGLLQAGLMHLLPAPISIIGSLLIASLVFGLCHYLSHTYFLLATLAGFYFGLLMLVSGSVIPAIMAHALYDFIALAYLLSEAQRPFSPAR